MVSWLSDLDPLSWTPNDLKFQSTKEDQHGGQDTSGVPTGLSGGGGSGDSGTVPWASSIRGHTYRMQGYHADQIDDRLIGYSVAPNGKGGGATVR